MEVPVSRSRYIFILGSGRIRLHVEHYGTEARCERCSAGYYAAGRGMTDPGRACGVCGAHLESWREGCPTCARAHAAAAVAAQPAPAKSGISQGFVMLLLIATALVGYVGCWRPLQDEALARRCGSDVNCYRSAGLNASEALERSGAAASEELRRR
jgi:hypothetical protein